MDDCSNKAKTATRETAILSNGGKYTTFAGNGEVVRFRTSSKLVCYKRVVDWDNGLLTVIAQYGGGEEEEFIDLVPILRNLLIEPAEFLKPIKRVEIAHA